MSFTGGFCSACKGKGCNLNMFVVLRVSRAAFSISFLAPSVCSNTVHEIKMDSATGRACSLPLLLAGSASPQFKYAPKEQYRNTGNRGIWNVKEEKCFTHILFIRSMCLDPRPYDTVQHIIFNADTLNYSPALQFS